MTKRMRKLYNRIKYLEAEVVKYKLQAEFFERNSRYALTENITLKLMLMGKAKVDLGSL